MHLKSCARFVNDWEGTRGAQVTAVAVQLVHFHLSFTILADAAREEREREVLLDLCACPCGADYFHFDEK